MWVIPALNVCIIENRWFVPPIKVKLSVYLSSESWRNTSSMEETPTVCQRTNANGLFPPLPLILQEHNLLNTIGRIQTVNGDFEECFLITLHIISCSKFYEWPQKDTYRKVTTLRMLIHLSDLTWTSTLYTSRIKWKLLSFHVGVPTVCTPLCYDRSPRVGLYCRRCWVLFDVVLLTTYLPPVIYFSPTHWMTN
jgi:hypothetical protein